MESLYFIAIIPSVEIQDEITHLKQEMSEQFGSKHALKSQPHITLHMPFKWKDKKLVLLKSLIEEINDQLMPFEIQLNGFDFFEPRVVFVDVVPNQSLKELQDFIVRKCRMDLNLDNGNYKSMPFHPHVTIGFRDLKKARFYEAKKYYEKREISFKFLVRKVQLLKNDGVRWLTYFPN